MTAQPGTTTPDQELAAMCRIADELHVLDPSAQMRAMVWLEARYPDAPPAPDDDISADHYSTAPSSEGGTP